jgi:hypothetical protein
MLREPTVFVIGAGAAKDFGFPIGSELIQAIRRSLSHTRRENSIRQEATDRYLMDALGRSCKNQAALIATVRTVMEAVADFRSIDDFLHSYGHDDLVKQVGKCSIARTISSYEYSSPVRKFWETNDAGAWRSIYADKWVFSLIQLLITGIKSARPEDIFKNIAVISFNYDRCLEAVLFHAIQAALRIQTADAADLMKTLEVHRPYGGLGNLRYTRQMEGVPFGKEDPDLVEMASRIRVYTEDLKDTEQLKGMHAAVARANAIVFLGFGFHHQNIKILDLEARGKEFQHVYATCYKEPAPAVERVRELLEPLAEQKLFLGHPDREPCLDFMRNHYMQLSG